MSKHGFRQHPVGNPPAAAPSAQWQPESSESMPVDVIAPMAAIIFAKLHGLVAHEEAIQASIDIATEIYVAVKARGAK